MSAPTKVRLVKKTLWVASRSGTATGYGDTPAKAQKDHARRAAAACARNKRQKRAEEAVAQDFQWLQAKATECSDALENEKRLVQGLQGQQHALQRQLAEARAIAAYAHAELDKTKDQLKLAIEENKARLLKPIVTQHVITLLLAGLRNGIRSPDLILQATNRASLSHDLDNSALAMLQEHEKQHERWLAAFDASIQPATSPTN